MTTQGTIAVSATMEDYLEAILKLANESGAARSRDISEELGVHRSTVTAALRSLAAKGLVNYVPYRAATLTRAGRALAERIGRTHDQIETFLREVLLIPAVTARENACRMEHVVDRTVLQRLVRLGNHLRSGRCGSHRELQKSMRATNMKETTR